MKEATIQRWWMEELTKKFPDSYIFKCPQGPYTSRKGIPDLIGCVDGGFFGIEVKTENGKLTKLQSHELFKINKAGGFSTTVYGKDKAMLEIIIKKLGG